MPPGGTGTRRPYTPAEELKAARFLINYPPEQRDKLKTHEFLALKHPEHTAQSWHSRFRDNGDAIRAHIRRLEKERKAAKEAEQPLPTEADDQRASIGRDPAAAPAPAAKPPREAQVQIPDESNGDVDQLASEEDHDQQVLFSSSPPKPKVVRQRAPFTLQDDFYLIKRVWQQMVKGKTRAWIYKDLFRRYPHHTVYSWQTRHKDQRQFIDDEAEKLYQGKKTKEQLMAQMTKIWKLEVKGVPLDEKKSKKLKKRELSVATDDSSHRESSVEDRQKSKKHHEQEAGKSEGKGKARQLDSFEFESDSDDGRSTIPLTTVPAPTSISGKGGSEAVNADQGSAVPIASTSAAPMEFIEVARVANLVPLSAAAAIAKDPSTSKLSDLDEQALVSELALAEKEDRERSEVWPLLAKKYPQYDAGQWKQKFLNDKVRFLSLATNELIRQTLLPVATIAPSTEIVPAPVAIERGQSATTVPNPLPDPAREPAQAHPEPTRTTSPSAPNKSPDVVEKAAEQVLVPASQEVENEEMEVDERVVTSTSTAGTATVIAASTPVASTALSQPIVPAADPSPPTPNATPPRSTTQSEVVIEQDEAIILNSGEDEEMVDAPANEIDTQAQSALLDSESSGSQAVHTVLQVEQETSTTTILRHISLGNEQATSSLQDMDDRRLEAQLLAATRSRALSAAPSTGSSPGGSQSQPSIVRQQEPPQRAPWVWTEGLEEVDANLNALFKEFKVEYMKDVEEDQPSIGLSQDASVSQDQLTGTNGEIEQIRSRSTSVEGEGISNNIAVEVLTRKVVPDQAVNSTEDQGKLEEQAQTAQASRGRKQREKTPSATKKGLKEDAIGAEEGEEGDVMDRQEKARSQDAVEAAQEMAVRVAEMERRKAIEDRAARLMRTSSIPLSSPSKQHRPSSNSRPRESRASPSFSIVIPAPSSGAKSTSSRKRPRASIEQISSSRANSPHVAPSSVPGSVTSLKRPKLEASSPLPALASSAEDNKPLILAESLKGYAKQYGLKYSNVKDLFFTISAPFDFIGLDIACKWFKKDRLTNEYPLRPEEGTSDYEQAHEWISKNVWNYDDDVVVLEGTDEAKQRLARKRGDERATKRRKRFLKEYGVESVGDLVRKWPFT